MIAAEHRRPRRDQRNARNDGNRHSDQSHHDQGDSADSAKCSSHDSRLLGRRRQAAGCHCLQARDALFRGRMGAEQIRQAP